jgi:hypothetical protein
MYLDELERVTDYIHQMELKSRKDEFKFQRYYLMKYLRQGTTLSLENIGKIFGKDHATVINALKRVNILEPHMDYQMYTNELALQFPMEGLLVNSNIPNGGYLTQSLLTLEMQLFFSKPRLNQAL